MICVKICKEDGTNDTRLEVSILSGILNDEDRMGLTDAISDAVMDYVCKTEGFQKYMDENRQQNPSDFGFGDIVEGAGEMVGGTVEAIGDILSSISD